MFYCSEVKNRLRCEAKRAVDYR